MASDHLKITNLFNVKGQVAFVTGGGTGIGLMISQALAANGMKVYIGGRRTDVIEKTAKTYEGEIIPVELDIGDKASIEKAVDFVSSKEKKLDLLVNNAGQAGHKYDVSTGDKGVEEFKKECFANPMSDWEDIYRANVVGYYYVSIAFAPLLVAANSTDSQHKTAKDFHPSIINISSISGITKTTQSGQFIYNTSKAATIQLNKLLATEFSRETISVRVNSIAPGYFPSEMTGSDSNEENKTELKQENWRKEKMVPSDRHGRDEDMAQLAIMLHCNKYINGQTVVIDGGVLIEMP